MLSINYVGSTSNKDAHGEWYKMRNAIISFDEDSERDIFIAHLLYEVLEVEGYEALYFESGCCCFKVDDPEEYDELLNDYKHFKKDLLKRYPTSLFKKERNQVWKLKI